jgi:uncharacterized protein with LGFP repeats
VNDALAVYFLGATIASAFVARWCAAQGSRSWMGYIGSATTNATDRVGSPQDDLNGRLVL